MKKWKIIFETGATPPEIIVEAQNYFHAHVKAELKYPKNDIKSVSEIKS